MTAKTFRAILTTFLLCGPAISVVSQSVSQKELSIQETIYLPAAGCDNGVAVPNFALPKVGGATPKCNTAQPNSALQSVEKIISRNKLTTEVGTIILIGISHDQVILAADSRSGKYVEQNFKGVSDLRCKVIALTPRLLFAASGLTSTRATIPARIDYDAQEVAQSIARNFVFDPNWMQRNETIKEIGCFMGVGTCFSYSQGTRKRYT
jgi:hypothetical protein